MTKSFIEFINESPLFKKEYIDDQYRSLSERDLKRALAAYREYCLAQGSETKPRKAGSNLSILTEGAGSFLPSQSLLRQAALYVEEMVINDPVFEFTSRRNKSSKAINTALEVQSASINRGNLAKAALYVIQLQPALQAGFVTFSPISYLHEPPQDIPLLHSDTGFADVLPKEILDWFIAAAQVFPMRIPDDGKGLYVAIGEPLTPCRAIDIHFKEHPSFKEDALYLFYEKKSVSLDEATDMAQIALTLPQEPPTEARFNAWVSQSVNQASRRFFDRVAREVYEAGRIGATYLTQSPFVADLLGTAWQQTPDLHTDVLKSVLGLDLPYLDGVSLERVLQR